MRALVISDTHFGTWTGRDLLREEFFLDGWRRSCRASTHPLLEHRLLDL